MPLLPPDRPPTLPPTPPLLVTGAAGFLGAHLVARLLASGHRVLGLDDLSTGSVGNLVRLGVAGHPGLTLVEGDAAGTLAGLPAGEPVAGVFHLAASVGVARVLADPAAAAENNLDQTRAVLAFAQARPGGVPVLLASSSEVYGKCPAAVCAEGDDLVFGPTASARWSYGLAKALDEHLGLAAARSSDLRVVIARLFNAVGLGQVGRHGMVLPRFVAAAATGGVLGVHGDGRQSRCFCDARDTARGLADLLLGGHRGVFNLGGDQPVAIRALAEAVRERALALGLPGGRVELQPRGAAYGEAFEEPRQRVPDLTRIRAATGWSPLIPLSQTIDELLREPTPTPGSGDAPAPGSGEPIPSPATSSTPGASPAEAAP